MDKIASPQELQSKLRAILAYTQEAKPSREKIAADLNALADKVAAGTPEPDMAKREAAVKELMSTMSQTETKIAKPFREIEKTLEDLLRKAETVSGLFDSVRQKETNTRIKNVLGTCGNMIDDLQRVWADFDFVKDGVQRVEIYWKKELRTPIKKL